MSSFEGLGDLSLVKLNSVINQLRRENSCLKTDLIKSELLLKSYQKYFNICDEITETIASKFGSNQQIIELKAEINVLKAFKEQSCSVSLKKLSDKCLRETNVRRVWGSPQPIDHKTQESENEGKDEEDNNEEDDKEVKVKEIQKKSEINRKKKWFRCDFKGCSTVVKQFASLKKHRNIHTDLFLCGVNGCQYRAGQASHLVNHKKAIHTLKPKKPNESNKVSDTQSKSSKEVVKTHKSEVTSRVSKDTRKFVCPFKSCGFRTWQSANLVRHKIYKHSNERPFKCWVRNCKKRFKISYDCKKHLKSYHKMNEKQINETLKTIKGQSTNKGFKVEKISESMVPQINKFLFEDIPPLNDFSSCLYVCPLDSCGKILKSKELLTQHKTNDHNLRTDNKDSGVSQTDQQKTKSKNERKRLSETDHKVIDNKSDETLEQQMDDNSVENLNKSSNESLDQQMETVLDQTNKECAEELEVIDTTNDKQMERQQLTDISFIANQ